MRPPLEKRCLAVGGLLRAVCDVSGRGHRFHPQEEVKFLPFPFPRARL
jgi:hypothetical protein